MTIFLVIVAILALWCILNKMRYDNWRYAISMDGRGYYSYLPALFIYNDPTFSFYKKQSATPPDSANYMNRVEGKLVNKYFAGEALCQLPFFLISHLTAKVSGYRANGYTQPYQYGLALGALFYFIIGLLFLWKLLATFHFRTIVILFTSICFAAGTNLLHYAIFEPSMAHIYSFSAITTFLYFCRKFMMSPSRKGIILTGSLLGIVTLIRPVDIIVFFAFPFLAGNLETLKIALSWIKANIFSLAVSVMVFISICLIQLSLYYWQTGHFFVWSYKSEGFNFTNPHIFGTLFSYEKGLFVYTPMLLIGVFGLALYAIKSSFKFLSLLVLLCLIIFIVSSWHDWRYGFSFGARAYVDFYALIAVPFAFLINTVLNRRRLFLLSILICLSLIVLYLIQQHQYVRSIIHPATMDKDRYWMVFLHTEKKYEDTLRRLPYIPESEGDFNDMEGSVDWIGAETIAEGPAHSGIFSAKIDSVLPYSVGICKKVSGEMGTSYEVEISAWIMRMKETDQASLAIAQMIGDSAVFIKYAPLPVFTTSGKWQNIQHRISIPRTGAKNEYLKVFFVHQKGAVYIDDFSAKISD